MAVSHLLKCCHAKTRAPHQYNGFANQYLNTTNNPGLYNTLGGTSTSGALPGSALYQ